MSSINFNLYTYKIFKRNNTPIFAIQPSDFSSIILTNLIFNFSILINIRSLTFKFNQCVTYKIFIFVKLKELLL